MTFFLVFAQTGLVTAKVIKVKTGDKLVAKDGAVRWVAVVGHSRWTVEREDIDGVNILAKSFEDCKDAHTLCMKNKEELAKRQPSSKPLIHTTTGNWVIGVSVAGLVATAGIVGYNLGRK